MYKDIPVKENVCLEEVVGNIALTIKNSDKTFFQSLNLNRDFV